MARGQLPKAYLRLDPDIDEIHPDWPAMVQAMLCANRQRQRGVFRELTVLERKIGADRLAGMQARGDLHQLDDGRWYLQGWDTWQEGDWTVGERMRRVRDKKKRNSVTDELRPCDVASVTQTVTPPSPTSEASRRLGVNETPPYPPSLPARGDRRTLPTGKALDALVQAACQQLADRGAHVGRRARRILRDLFRGGRTPEQVDAAIAAGEFDTQEMRRSAQDHRFRLQTLAKDLLSRGCSLEEALTHVDASDTEGFREAFTSMQEGEAMKQRYLGAR